MKNLTWLLWKLKEAHIWGLKNFFKKQENTKSEIISLLEHDVTSADEFIQDEAEVHNPVQDQDEVKVENQELNNVISERESNVGDNFDDVFEKCIVAADKEGIDEADKEGINEADKEGVDEADKEGIDEADKEGIDEADEEGIDEADEEDDSTNECCNKYNYSKSLFNQISLDPVLIYALENWKWEILRSVKCLEENDEYDAVKQEMIDRWCEKIEFKGSLLQKISESYVYFRALEKLDIKFLNKLKNGTLLYNDYIRFAENNNIDVLIWSLWFKKYHDFISSKSFD